MIVTHPSELGFFVNMSAAVAYFGLTMLFVFVWWVRLRPWFTLIGAGWLALLCAYFSMLAISAGPDPVVDRTALVYPIRYTNLAATGLATAWALAWVAQIAGMLLPRVRVRFLGL